MANKITNTQHYQDIADAIRAKNGLATTYTPAQMAQAIEDIPSGSDTLAEAMAGTFAGELVIDYGNKSSASPGTQIVIQPNTNTGITKIKYSCISGCKERLSPLGVCNGTTSLLSEIDFGNLEETYLSLGAASFGQLATITGDKLKKAWSADFLRAAGAVISINLPLLESMPARGIYGERSLEYAYFDSLTSLNYPGSNFAYNSKLKKISLPELTTLQASVFQACTSLPSITLPKASIGYSYVFADCTSLDLVDLGGNGGTIGTGTFRNCPLTALVLRSSTVVTLSSTSAFQNSNVAAGTGYIYVPRSLISSYESASNWSNYAGQFRALEDYTNDGTTTGEFIMPT